MLRVSRVDEVVVQGQGMRAAEMLVWVGDFNYRINCSYEEAKEGIRRGRLEQLLAKARAGGVHTSLRDLSEHLANLDGSPLHTRHGE